MKEAAPPALVRALLDEAGISGAAEVVEVASPGRVNTTTIVAVAGERYAVRVYGWPFDGTCSFDRGPKEAALHPRLQAEGVPVPAVLSLATVDGRDGALLEWAPGELLGVVAQRVPADDLDEAWRETAASLRRVHALDGGPVAGFLTAEGVAPFRPGLLSAGGPPFAEGTYGGLVASDLVARGRDLGGLVDADLVGRVAEALVPVLDARPVRVGHSDANPWNVLVVEPPSGGWRLSAWLDWEFAWAADPAYDLMRATVQRYAPIGPTPRAFWEGYGSEPDPVGISAATLHYVLGAHVEHLGGGRSPEVLQAIAHGPDPATVLHRLADLVL